MSLGKTYPNASAPSLMVAGTLLRIFPMALAISVEALTRAMVPLIIKTAFKIPSIMRFPIPKVKTPNTTLPRTLPAETRINCVIAFEMGFSGAAFLMTSRAHLM